MSPQVESRVPENEFHLKPVTKTQFNIMNLPATIEFTLVLAVVAIYIIQCPFNKVEESFNTHAVHDIISLLPQKLPHNDRPLSNATDQYETREVSIRSQLPWDHIIFPGVVPRTFIGALLVGLPMKLVRHLMSEGLITDLSPNDPSSELSAQLVLQMGSRFALASFLVLSSCTLTKAIHKRYGVLMRLCYLAATSSQFHYLFYASRFIPNTYAAILTNLVLASWIDRRYSKSIIYMAMCVAIFRFDTILFFGWLLLDGVFIKQHISLKRVLLVGLPAGILSILLTTSVDSIMWAELVWPEFQGLYFNVWLNKSSEWGTYPYLWYIYSCLPRLLLSSAPFILLSDHKVTRDYLLPTMAFILTYSILPHKELRFILFIVPALNLCVASGLINVYRWLVRFSAHFNIDHKGYVAFCLFAIVVAGMVTVNSVASYTLMKISSLNYPGGHAAISIGTSREIGRDGFHPAVYVNNLAAQTGFSRFLQRDGVYYCKTSKLDFRSFKKDYNIVYLVLEPQEVLEFLQERCGLATARDSSGVDWIKEGLKSTCRIPNQSSMRCTLGETIEGFKSVDTRKLFIGKERESYLRTEPALHILKCIK